MKKSQTTIHGDKWTIFLISKNEMKKLDGTSVTEAVTFPGEKRIYFQDVYFNTDTIAHEIFHAYKSYLCLEAATEIDSHSFEEIMCEMYALNRFKMQKTINDIYRKLK